MINLNTPINSLGYGVVGYNVWNALSGKTEVCLYPIGGQISPPCQLDEETVSKIKADLDKSSSFNKDAPTLKIWHENQLHERLGCSKYFALPFFEINKFDERRKTHLNSVDHLFAPSEWAKQVCVNNNITVPITVTPCGVDRHIFNEYHYQLSGVDHQKCVFYNCGKWEVRKGHDILWQAFRDAFPNNESVELWMMNENPFLNPQERQSWENKYQAYNVKLINRVESQQELAQIMSKTFCGVFPARAEGWNLELLEMMSMGKQVITTDYSAHTQFCNDDNAKLIKMTEEEQAYDGKWFMGDVGTWFKFNQDAYDQLVSHLREVYKTWESDPATINKNGTDTAINLSWDNTAQIILSAMEQ